MDSRLRNFIEEHSIEINSEKWEEVYEFAKKELTLQITGLFTSNLLSIRVDPAKSLSIVPEGYLYMSDVSSYTIPSSVEKISDYAFTNCTNLTNISIPQNVEVIGRNAFARSGIESIKFSEGLKIIYPNAFQECDLEDVYLPDSLESIYTNAFFLNYYLKSVSIGQGIEQFGADIFHSCKKLKEITYRGPVEKFKRISGQAVWNYKSTVKRVICSDGVITL